MKFIKTINASFHTADFVEELKDNEISFEYGDTGIYVSDEDYDAAMDIYYEMEE